MRTWQHIKTHYEGNHLTIDGYNADENLWVPKKQFIKVSDPLRGEEYQAQVFTILENEKIEFAATEFSNCVWGIYQEKEMNESSLEKIENLNQEFLEIGENEYDKFIHFYDNNKNFIEQIDINQSEQHLDLKLKVIGNYGRALFLTAKFKEAIASLEEAIKIMSSKNLTAFYYYEFLRSIYGESLYFSKNYKKAKDIFLKLKTDFPEKRIYSSWYNYSHFRSLKWITSTLLVIGGLLMVGDKYIIPDNPFAITIFGITIIALTILGEWIIKQALNKNHKIAQKEKITNPNKG